MCLSQSAHGSDRKGTTDYRVRFVFFSLHSVPHTYDPIWLCVSCVWACVRMYLLRSRTDKNLFEFIWEKFVIVTYGCSTLSRVLLYAVIWMCIAGRGRYLRHIHFVLYTDIIYKCILCAAVYFYISCGLDWRCVWRSIMMLCEHVKGDWSTEIGFRLEISKDFFFARRRCLGTHGGAFGPSESGAEWWIFGQSSSWRNRFN